MPNLEETILAARKEQAQGNWRQALGLYSKILNEEPQYLDLYLERSECLIRLDSYSLAFKDLTKIMNTTAQLSTPIRETEHIFEIRADALYCLGKNFFSREENWEMALSTYEESPRILNLLGEDPERIAKKARIHVKRGNIYHTKKEEREKAIIEFTKAIRITKRVKENEMSSSVRSFLEINLNTAYYSRAQCYEKSEEFELARINYLELGDLSGNFYSGKMFFFVGNFEEAEKHFQVCVDLPNNSTNTAKTEAALFLLKIKEAKGRSFD